MVSPKRMPVFLSAFIIVNLLLSSYFLDIWPTPNPVSRALPVLTFSENRTLMIDNYADRSMDKSRVGDHFYSDKAPLPTFMVIPFYVLARAAGLDNVSDRFGKQFPIHILKITGVNDARPYIFTKLIPILLIGDLLAGSAPFVAIILLSFLELHRRKPSLSPVILVMLAFYGSIVFVFSGTFFNHVFAGFLLLASYIGLKRSKYLMSGIFLGLGFLSEYPLLIAAPIWLVLILIKERRIKPAALFASGILPSILFILIYNWRIAGAPFKMLNAYHAVKEYSALSQHYGFSYPSFTSVWGLSFSGSMGIFVFAPVLLFIGYYLIKAAIQERALYKKVIIGYLPLFSIAFFLLIASFFTWWGGWSYGPRYLIVLIVLLIYEGLLFISHYKINFIAYSIITAFGIISTWFAKSTLVYFIPDLFLQNKHFSNTFLSILVPEFNADRFNSNNLPTLLFNIRPATGVCSWIFLFVLAVIVFYLWYEAWFVEKNSVA
jgi:hypothetical protein